MESMTININDFKCNYDTKTKSLTMAVLKGSILNSDIERDKLKVTLNFDPEKTWLLGEMVSILMSNNSYSFGEEPQRKKAKAAKPTKRIRANQS